MKFDCLDFLGISEHFSEEEIMVQKMANKFVVNEVMPTIEEHYKNGGIGGGQHVAKKGGSQKQDVKRQAMNKASFGHD